MNKILTGLGALALLTTGTAAYADHGHKRNKARIVVQVAPTTPYVHTNPYSYRYTYPYDYRYGHDNYNTYDYYNRYGHYHYTTGYYGPIWKGPQGIYLCRRPNGRVGILTDRYGIPVNRHHTPFYSISRHRLRCR